LAAFFVAFFFVAFLVAFFFVAFFFAMALCPFKTSVGACVHFNDAYEMKSTTNTHRCATFIDRMQRLHHFFDEGLT
jgi:hypothetical protein